MYFASFVTRMKRVFLEQTKMSIELTSIETTFSNCFIDDDMFKKLHPQAVDFS